MTTHAPLTPLHKDMERELGQALLTGLREAANVSQYLGLQLVSLHLGKALQEAEQGVRA